MLVIDRNAVNVGESVLELLPVTVAVSDVDKDRDIEIVFIVERDCDTSTESVPLTLSDCVELTTLLGEIESDT